MSADRRQARILAMQALCQWDAQKDDSSDALADLFAASEGSAQSKVYATKLVTAYWVDRKSVDESIESAVTNWSLSRISPVERNVIRVAVVELRHEWVPPRVALDEAIEIGREYGGANSPRFINGVLDAVLRGNEGKPEADAKAED